MHYLYGSKRSGTHRLAAKFCVGTQLLAYVRWATFESHGERRGKFEQKSALAGYDRWKQSNEPLNDDDADAVVSILTGLRPHLIASPPRLGGPGGAGISLRLPNGETKPAQSRRV
jgi:hypothetical protein